LLMALPLCSRGGLVGNFRKDKGRIDGVV